MTLIKSTESIDNENCFRFITQQIAREINPYQVTLFIDNLDHAKFELEHEILLKIFMKTLPSVVIHRTALIEFSKQRDLNLPTFMNPTSSIIHIILLHQSMFNKDHQLIFVQEILDFLIRTSQKSTQAKYLLIILSDNAGIVKDTYHVVFLQAWKKKILDISIIEINTEKQLYFLHYYNPFYNSYSKVKMRLNLTIFNDKLKNLNGYPFKLAILHDCLDDKKIYPLFDNNNIFDVNGKMNVIDPVIFTALNKLNVTLMPIVEDTSYMNHIKRTFLNLHNGSVNLMQLPTSVFLQSTVAIQHLMIDFQCTNLIALVPILPSAKINIATIFIIHLCVVPFLAIGIIVLVELVKITEEPLGTTNVIRILLGFPVSKSPRTCAQRFIFLSILLFSILYSNDLYNSFISAVTVQNQVAFDTFKEIDESQLQTYVLYSQYNSSFLIDDEHVQNIKKKVLKIKEVDTCANVLVKNRNCICLISVARASKFVEKYRKEGIMKIAKPTFKCDRKILHFEKASPYIMKMKELFIRIYESGAWKVHKSSIFHTYFIEGKSLENKIDHVTNNFLLPCIFVLFSGYTLSIFAIVIEIAVNI